MINGMIGILCLRKLFNISHNMMKKIKAFYKNSLILANKVLTIRLILALALILSLSPQRLEVKDAIADNNDESEDVYAFLNVVVSDEARENFEIVVISAKENNKIAVKTATDVLASAKKMSARVNAERYISAYNSEAAQCDSTPCVTANGFNVCEYGVEDTIAANFLKFGTKVKIPELFGDKVFVVRDRMHPRYANRVDIWMKDKADAKQFGVKLAKVEVVLD
jgi:3D (Asp-Asp-Asp) domain-containing protein